MKTVLIVFGGRSSEYEVSLRSACAVIDNIDKSKYSIELLGITKEGKWLYYQGSTEEIFNNTWYKNESCVPAIVSPDYSDKAVILLGNPIKKIYPDLVFPVLHGKNGEDGTIQGLFELAGIPYVGCDMLSSAMCMDKAVTNMTADYYSIKQAKWLECLKSEYTKDKDTIRSRAKQYLSYPLFVKPANAGSSVGVSKVSDDESFDIAMQKAFQEDYKVVIEEAIVGIEVECAVLGHNEHTASVVGEIVPCAEFYDYDAKYINDSELYIPARLSNEVSEKIRAQALRVFKVLGCSGLSRVDFFYNKDSDELFFNEINTIPGFTSISMYSKLFGEYGISYSELLDRLFIAAEEKASR